MNDSEKIKSYILQLKRYTWAVTVAWTIVVAISLVLNMFQIKKETLDAARIQARAAYEKDVIYRRWNAEYGGIYVPVTEETQPNPYLTDINERDITTLSGKLLTLINPAYMTRQVHELGEKEHGVRAHITSLNTIRPENAPDPWETEALHAFERGKTEISSVKEMEGEEYMRLMLPLITENGCLKCHAAQGYKEGDIRGGISVSIPMEPLKAIAGKTMVTFGLGHVVLWLMGLVGIVMGTQRLRRSEQERTQAAEDLLKAHDELEIQVQKRTAEMARVNEALQAEITERKKAEEALREREAGLAEAQRIAHIGSWIFDKETNELFWSDEIYRIFGLSPEEIGSLYEAFWDSVHPDDRESVKKSLNEATKNNIPHDIVHRIVRPDGTERFVHELAEVIFDENGKPLREVGTVQDITDRKWAEEELKKYREHLEELVAERANELDVKATELEQANIQLKELDQLKSMFIASMSHELRTPLNSIIGFTDIILEGMSGKLLRSKESN